MKFASSRTEKMWMAGAVVAVTALSSAVSGAVHSKQQQHGLLQDAIALSSDRLGGDGVFGGEGVARRNLQEDTCDMIEIFGSQFDGTYMDLGWTFGGKPLFFSMGDLAPHVMFYSEGGMSSSSSSGDSADGEGEETRRGRLLQNAAPTAEDGVFTLHEDTLSALTAPLDGKLSTAVSAVRDATATLAECVDGFWALLPFSLEEEETDYFPIYLSFDCADHPIDISAQWYMIDDAAAPTVSSGESEIEEAEEVAEAIEEDNSDGFGGPVMADLSFSFACEDDETETEELEVAGSACINLGADGCENKTECCMANEINADAKCWDGRCCNKSFKPCTKDKQCCDGLDCMNGLCANPREDKCVSLGNSGCYDTDSCCSANDMNADAMCNKGRCCNKDGGGCKEDIDCCDGYMCDMENATCVVEA